MPFVYLHVIWFALWIGLGVEAYPVRAPDDDRVPGGDLPVDVRDDQPEPSRREARVARGAQWQLVQAEEKQNEELLDGIAPDPGPHEADPFDHEGLEAGTFLSRTLRLLRSSTGGDGGPMLRFCVRRRDVGGSHDRGLPRARAPRRNPSSNPGPHPRASSHALSRCSTTAGTGRRGRTRRSRPTKFVEQRQPAVERGSLPQLIPRLDRKPSLIRERPHGVHAAKGRTAHDSLDASVGSSRTSAFACRRPDLRQRSSTIVTGPCSAVAGFRVTDEVGRCTAGGQRVEHPRSRSYVSSCRDSAAEPSRLIDFARRTQVGPPPAAPSPSSERPSDRSLLVHVVRWAGARRRSDTPGPSPRALRGTRPASTTLRRAASPSGKRPIVVARPVDERRHHLAVDPPPDDRRRLRTRRHHLQKRFSR